MTNQAAAESQALSEAPPAKRGNLNSHGASKFRIIAYVLQAARRFKAAVNPKITLAKREAPVVEQVDYRRALTGLRMAPGTQESLRTSSGTFKKAGSRGVSSYLFRPLPPVT